MYPFLISLHSLWRWLVLGSLIYSIYVSYNGFISKKKFTAAADNLRHWTATIIHIQLVLGMSIYIQSPVVKYHLLDSPHNLINEQYFFRYFHLAMMLVAVILITIGSARAKRSKDGVEKYRIMFKWFSLGLAVIFIAIPWPFSPLTSRPYIRSF
ncbi:hypothetical protein [Mucilaginibacter sp. PAMB04168]|uniref:hypothetical protein n=1 Tax=Mucilaginibacter sp. PAMB04168 TaxID=3138567 RepID=UPI0031F5F810